MAHLVTFTLVFISTVSCMTIENNLKGQFEFDEEQEINKKFSSVRDPKQYWPEIGLVRFANNICTTLDGYNGVCVTRRQCSYIDGYGSGSCTRNGVGRCCLIQRTCGQASAYNNTYFSNFRFPNTFNGDSTCTFTIVACPGNSCQVRIDFLNFVLAQPDGNGNCVDDSMVISGSGENVPIICGDNSGQHVYLNFVGNNSITITITTSSTVNLERNYHFLVTQIACDCPTLAPAGCLQYYTQLTNTVRSFNYGTQINGAVVPFGNGSTVAGTRQMANTNYGICVHMRPGYCSVQWAQSGDGTSFSVSSNTALTEVINGLPSQPIIAGNCTTDFIVIPNPSYVNGTAANTDRFCGNQFNSVVTFSKPFVLTTVTDASELTSDDVANRGFSLTYTQQACRNVNALLLFTANTVATG